MTAVLSLRLYFCVGAVYGVSVVAIAEATRQSEVAAVPLRRMAHVYAVTLALGALIWPLALLWDRSGGF